MEEGGFVVFPGKQGAAYYLTARVRKQPTSSLHILIKYENPLDPTRPFVNTHELSPGMNEIGFSSPDTVSGLRNYGTYQVKVEIFESAEATTPVDTLTQPIRSYVDTTTNEVRAFRGIESR